MRGSDIPAPATSTPELDAGTIAFAAKMFGLARNGFWQDLDEYLRQGVPANLTNDKGDTLLILAAYHGHDDTVQVLLDHGADPERANDRGQTALAAASFKGAIDIVEAMLDHGARVDGASPGGRTALMTAAMFNRREIVDLLLARGADPALRDADGMTAHAAAVKMGAADTPARLEAALAGRET